MMLAPITSRSALLAPMPRSDVDVPPATPALTPAPSAQEALLIDRMKASETLQHITALNVAPRTWNTPGFDAGVAYVTDQMAKIGGGWDVHVEELPTRSGLYHGVVKDIVATRRGTSTVPDATRPLVLAGAHLDSVRRGPGANDNASGSSTLLELAKSFDGVATPDDIKLVWFDGEEEGLLGSAAYAEKHMDDIARTIAMVNMDMVGSIHGRVGFDLGINTKQSVSDVLTGVELRTGLSAVEYAERHARSDHASFDRWRIPAIDFGVSVKDVMKDDPYYHSPQDTVDKVNPQVLEGYGDLIAVTLLDLANRSERP
jgi:hypothetical protein